jgi:hypothetical protein
MPFVFPSRFHFNVAWQQSYEDANEDIFPRRIAIGKGHRCDLSRGTEKGISVF